mmetsp:Transcript_35478/g.65276  ORF Transcript_35478/g.65276 Transcript_35478/m.65276 type:complete len:718 (-) Transcript_35478:74-2227(-)
MPNVMIALACLACAGRGSRVRRSTLRLAGSHLSAGQALDAGSNQLFFAQVNQSRGQWRAEHDLNRLEALAELLLAFNSAVAFQPSASGHPFLVGSPTFINSSPAALDKPVRLFRDSPEMSMSNEVKADLNKVLGLRGGLSHEALSVEALSAEPYNQAHLFAGASAEESERLLKQLQDIDEKLPGGGLKGYLERARSFLADARLGTNPFAGLVPKVPTGQRLTGDTGPGSEKYAELETLGEAQLAKCTFCLVAGGLGERLGYPGIKIGITAEVTTGTRFIEIYVEYIKAFQAHARKATGDATLELPLAIMTSGDTHQPTVELFKENENFGLSPGQVTFMQQEKVPALMDLDARIASTDGVVQTKPHGHGDVHSLLHQHGLIDKWADEGRQWLVIFQDTNPLSLRSLCAILGVSAKNDFAMNSVAVPRIPGETIGGIATLEDPKDGKQLTINVEYNQLDPLLKETPIGGDVADDSGFSPYPGNTNILVFKVPAMASCLKATGGIVPEFVNPKWADAEKSKFKAPTRLECMMQDFPRLCGPNDKVGFTQLERSMCLTVVKNKLADAVKKATPDCALSAEAHIYANNARLLELAGADVEIEAPGNVSFLGISAQMGARIILKPSFGVSLEAMKKKVRGKIRISKQSVLVVDGDVSIDGLDLDGALHLSGPSGSVAKDLAVKNAGSQLVAIPEAELAAQAPSFQIRGYRPAEEAIEKVVLSA